MICPRCRKCELCVDQESEHATYCPNCGFMPDVDKMHPIILEWLKVKK